MTHQERKDEMIEKLSKSIMVYFAERGCVEAEIIADFIISEQSKAVEEITTVLNDYKQLPTVRIVSALSIAEKYTKQGE